MELNINNQCKVTLTKKGAEWLNKYHQQQIDDIQKAFVNMQDLINSEIELNKIYPTTYKEDDEVKLPIWELMLKFGEYFTESSEAPFIDNNIIINRF